VNDRVGHHTVYRARKRIAVERIRNNRLAAERAECRDTGGISNQSDGCVASRNQQTRESVPRAPLAPARRTLMPSSIDPR
jgi:hypothetical protein